MKATILCMSFFFSHRFLFSWEKLKFYVDSLFISVRSTSTLLFQVSLAIICNFILLHWIWLVTFTLWHDHWSVHYFKSSFHYFEKCRPNGQTHVTSVSLRLTVWLQRHICSRDLILFIGLKLVESPKVKQKQQFFNPLPAIQITTMPLF